jgi:hypothetical protein
MKHACRLHLHCCIAYNIYCFLCILIIGCDCSWRPGGCLILRPAKEGFKCRCDYMGIVACKGVEVNCESWEFCPGGRYSREHCSGDCGGYDYKGAFSTFYNFLGSFVR